MLHFCPVVSICHLEQTCAFDGIDSDIFWDELLRKHNGRLGSFRNYDINAHEALRVSHSSGREKYFAFLTAMIFSGDRFSGHYAMFINETGIWRDYYEGGTPPAKERDCPNDIVNYLVAYRKPIVVDSEVIVEEADTEEPVSQRYSSKEDEESCEGSDDQFYYPLPARDVFGLKCGKLFKEATKGQGIHSRYSHYILKENHYRLSDEDAVSLMMNKCHYYPKKLFMHEYNRMHWMWSHDNLIQLLTQFFSQLESLSLCLRQGKDIDDYITYTPGEFKEALELVYTCCFSSPVLSSLVILDPVRDDMASLPLFSTLAANPIPSLKVLDIHFWIRYSGETHSLEALANAIASHSQLTEIRLRLDRLRNAASSFSCLYTSLIGFVRKQEFTKLTLQGLVHISSQLPLFFFFFFFCL